MCKVDVEWLNINVLVKHYFCLRDVVDDILVAI